MRHFVHNVALDVHYTFPGYTPCSNEGNIVEGTIAQLAHPDASVATMVTYLTGWKRRGSHRQETYADTYAFYVTAVISQFVRRVGLFRKPGNRTNYILQQLSSLVTVWCNKNVHY